MKLLIFAAIFALARAQEAYQTKTRDLHNQYRKKHQSPAVTLNATMNDTAVKCAKYYANQQKIDHTCPQKNDALGENLMYGYPFTKEQLAKTATNAWYNEIKLYDYNKPGYSPQTGHFTQLVWKASVQVGVGCVIQNGYTYFVTLYYPRGNIIGNNNQYFRDNVLPPTALIA